MRKDNKPTDEQLKELYQAASNFKLAQPWNWLYDADIICIENPKDKTMGYCSIMGRGGEHYALGVYLGDEGIFGFYNLMENSDTIPDHQVLHFQNCLMCSFEDRDQLANEDRKQIKTLGLSFRGRNAWPMFRRFEPGYNPWFINQEECIFLTHALRQTLFVATNVMTGQLRMDMEQGKTILRYSEEKDGKLEWYCKEIQLAFPTVSYSPVTISDDVLIQKIKKAGSMGDVSLQADTCYMPSAVQENKDKRPYFPRIFILAEQKSGQVLDFEIYGSVRDDANVTLNKLIGMCLEKGIPKEIQVRSEAMAAILDDFCKKAGIKLKVVKRLSGIDQVIEEMAYRF
ncbi:hypothetical protein CU633_18065 [Bacillus sp. V3-13]|uniref:DUF7309 domain-containing protein n=1 Tax=Bacillus sp. V3-13 TaxID=2053728 RepID=UPI000C78A8B6|nr:hypothetical protein [Bacillus sp. V3-13]PLR75973.1 hypothetical protein CU633_18065 [Bacillus sp. V3-13]